MSEFGKWLRQDAMIRAGTARARDMEEGWQACEAIYKPQLEQAQAEQKESDIRAYKIQLNSLAEQCGVELKDDWPCIMVSELVGKLKQKLQAELTSETDRHEKLTSDLEGQLGQAQADKAAMREILDTVIAKCAPGPKGYHRRLCDIFPELMDLVLPIQNSTAGRVGKESQNERD